MLLYPAGGSNESMKSDVNPLNPSEMEYDFGQRPFIGLFGRRRFRLFLGQHSLRGLQRSLRPRLPARRIDKGMRIARFAGRQQLSPLKNAAAGIAIGWLPRMGHEVHLHTPVSAGLKEQHFRRL